MTSAITDTFANALQKRVSADALGEQPADAQGLEIPRTNSDEAEIPMTNPQTPPEETNAKDAEGDKCKRQVQPENLPSTALPSNGGLINCKPCLSKTATLSKMFGKWPIPDFDELTDQERTDFWRAGNTRADLPNQLTKSVCEVTEKTKTNSTNGMYRPLSWYENSGFDFEKIKHNCTDTEEHEIFGVTYRVDLRSVGKAETENVVQERLRKVGRQGQRLGRGGRVRGGRGRGGRGRQYPDSATSSAESGSSSAGNKGSGR